MPGSTSKYLDSFKEKVVKWALEQDTIDYIELEKKFNVPRKTVYNWIYKERMIRRKKNDAMSRYDAQMDYKNEQNGSEPITASMLHQVEPKEDDKVTWIVPGGIVVDYLERIAKALEKLAELWEK